MAKSKTHYEYLRSQAKSKFDNVRSTWIDCGRWTLPHRIKWMLSQTEGERTNQHIVDSTHILALRSYVAGFLEGNTSASRPWYRIFSKSEDLNENPLNKAWLQKYTNRTLSYLTSSNFYHAAGGFYYDFGCFNTGGHYIDEIKGGLYFHNLVPGSYYVINNSLGEAIVLVREFALTVRALVDRYKRNDANGKADWSNISSRVKKMYEDGNYTQKIDIVHIVEQNEDYDPMQPQVLLNKKWLSCVYELGGSNGQYYQDGQEFGTSTVDVREKETYLLKSASKRKPFIIGKSESNSNFEYGEKGPTSDALGLIKSLNKKAIGKDQALEQMLRPALQGPANLKKSYITTAPNSYIPLDAASLSQKGLRSVFEINPAIGSIIQDVSDLRNQVEKLYYADYLLFLSQNPKTRTAAETNAVVQEQQLIIGPNLQSLNWTYNVPVVEFVMDYVLDEDPFLEPPPPELEGSFLQAEFISVFAQAQKAADLPAIDRYMTMVGQIGGLPGGEHIWDKANLDKLADLYEDRLFLPAGLNNPQGKVDAMRQQAAAAAERQRMMQETIPAMAGAAKDVGLQVNQKEQQ
jgi:hypothetical protein